MNKPSGCDYESTVVASLKSGFISEEIASHIKLCANCRETAKIVRFFQMNVIEKTSSAHLPAAGLIWWKSRLREKQRNAGRIYQPIFIVQVVALIVFTGLFFWLINTESFQASTFASAINRVISAADQIMISVLIGVICFLLIGVILFFTLRRFLLEE